MDFGQILDSKSYDQVCKYASMPVCQYARMRVYTCLYKKLNKKKDRARPYPRLRDFYYYIVIVTVSDFNPVTVSDGWRGKNTTRP